MLLRTFNEEILRRGSSALTGQWMQPRMAHLMPLCLAFSAFLVFLLLRFTTAMMVEQAGSKEYDRGGRCSVSGCREKSVAVRGSEAMAYGKQDWQRDLAIHNSEIGSR